MCWFVVFCYDDITNEVEYYLSEMVRVNERVNEIEDPEEKLPKDEEMIKMIDVSKALEIGKMIKKMREFSLFPLDIKVNTQINTVFMKSIRNLPLSHSQLLDKSREAEPLN